MNDLYIPPRPLWFTDLVAEVDRAFGVTGVDTPGWADPHPDRAPLEEEYSRCLDPDKYRILEARVDAWTQVLTEVGLVTIREESPDQWRGFSRGLGSAHVARVRLLEPVRAQALTVVVASTLVDGLPFGLDIGAGTGQDSAVLLEAVPDCGCDACDTGSADLLGWLDDCLLVVARGGVVHARDDRASVTRTADGWQGSGLVSHEDWLDESQDPPAGVQRWQGLSWR